MSDYQPYVPEQSGENTNQTPEQNRQTGSPSAVLVHLKQSLKQSWRWILASFVLLGVGDTWNIVLNVHERVCTIDSKVINGHQVFSYNIASKWLSDFIPPLGFSIGDILIYLGLIILTILAILFIINNIRNKNKEIK